MGDLNRSASSVNIVTAMVRNPLDGSGPRTSWAWKLRVINEAVQQGRHFMDILRDAGSESGLIIARIAREAGGRWGFHALGLPCRGRTYKDSLTQLRAACRVKTSSLLLRTQSTGSNLGESLRPTVTEL